MSTQILKEDASPFAKRMDRHQKKLSLALWVKLQHTQPDQSFDVLLTLENDPGDKEIQELQRKGLEITAFHQQQPARMLPGVITKSRLEKELVLCNFIHTIEGVARQI